jgi:TonB family protein
MNRYLLIAVIGTITTLTSIDSLGQSDDSKTGVEMPTMMHTMPVYPGAEPGLIRDIQANLVYPESAITSKTEGKVYVEFVVEKDGTITNVVVTLGIPEHPELNEAAVEAVKKLKPFTPATQNGQPVRMVMSMPVKFSPK